MNITLFTSNKSRHNYLINLLSKIANKLFVIQENESLLSDMPSNHESKSLLMKKYFEHVNKAQTVFFGNPSFKNIKSNTKILSIATGSLNNYSTTALKDFLQSDVYVVFGSSYIKGDLVNFLVKKKTINIHMGVSPYYRGTACNFWALYDNNPHLVGATIHLLSKGLDSGPMLYHAMSHIKNDPFLYTMSTVKSAFHSVSQKIKDDSIFKIKPIIQNKKIEIRYSRKKQFTDNILSKYFNKKINLNSKKFDKHLLKDPFFLEE
ncbi:formyltransferase family protein [Candidatus Pelagibacter sp.]|nr:formyltransferase family protein [Candidatus Pelagibacter sp.]